MSAAKMAEKMGKEMKSKSKTTKTSTRVKALKTPTKKWKKPVGGATVSTSATSVSKGSKQSSAALPEDVVSVGSTICSGGGGSRGSSVSVSDDASFGSSTNAPATKPNTALVRAMEDPMENESLCDVTLLGKDGAKVRAVKYMIGCRSPCLQEKLYDSETQASGEAFLGEYGAEVLKALKEFCHRGEISETTFGERVDETARAMVELADLALIYEFGPLLEFAENQLMEMLQGSAQLVFAVYDSSCSIKRRKRFSDFSLDFIKSRSAEIARNSTSGLQFLGARGLGCLLDDLEVNERSVFAIVSLWITAHGRSPENMEVAQLCFSTLDLGPLLSDPVSRRRLKLSGFVDRRVIEEYEGTVSAEDDEFGQPDEFEGICYQLTPQGSVIVCSIETSKQLPSFTAAAT